MNKFLLISLVFVAVQSQAQTPEEIIRAGNELYSKGDYAGAEREYSKVSADVRARYNLSNALYMQDKKNEATVINNDLSVTKTNESTIRSRSYYNQGVIFSGAKKLEESIEAYKNTLRLDPNDKEARENLQKALLELKKKNPPKKQEPKKQPKKPPPQPKMNQKQTEQKLKQLQQKEKQTQERLQQKRPVSTQPKDW